MRLRPTLLALLVAVAAAAGCSDDDLADATNPNQVQVDTMGALRFTAVSVPSAFNIGSRRSVRTDGGARFDFLYDLDSNGTPTFYPAEAAGVLSPSSANPGLMKVDVPFDSITIANSNGYILDEPIAVDSGDVFLMRSSILVCPIGVPFYGKLEVTQIDTVAKKIMFRFLVDENCGYRGLEPGIPER
jgi:hypothetical protein